MKGIDIYNEFKDNKKFNTQFYFFSEECIQIKNYFNQLYDKVVINNNNNNNDHFNEESFNYNKLAQQISVITNNSKHYKSIKAMIETDEALRVIVVLLFKGFSWTNEVLNDFNIDSKLYVVNTISTLKKLDLLTTSEGISLHPILFDAIKNSKSGEFRKSLHQAKIYFINPMFVKFCETLVELFEFKSKTTMGFSHSLMQTMKHSEIFSIQLREILEEELTQTTRRNIADNGMIYETDTILSQKINNNIKQALAEFKVEMLEQKQSQGLLTEQQNNQLTLYKETNNALAVFEESEPKKITKKGKPTITYNGKTYKDDSFLDAIKKQDKIIEKSKTILGNIDVSTIEEQRNNVKSEFDKIALSEELMRIDPLIKLIKSQKKVSVDRIARNLRLTESYNLFLDKCIDNSIKTDNEYFYFVYKSASDEADEVLSKFSLGESIEVENGL